MLGVNTHTMVCVHASILSSHYVSSCLIKHDLLGLITWCGQSAIRLRHWYPIFKPILVIDRETLTEKASIYTFSTDRHSRKAISVSAVVACSIPVGSKVVNNTWWKLIPRNKNMVYKAHSCALLIPPSYRNCCTPLICSTVSHTATLQPWIASHC